MKFTFSEYVQRMQFLDVLPQHIYLFKINNKIPKQCVKSVQS